MATMRKFFYAISMFRTRIRWRFIDRAAVIEAWEKVVQSMNPEQVIEEVKASGLRARRRWVSYRHEMELRSEKQSKA